MIPVVKKTVRSYVTWSPPEIHTLNAYCHLKLGQNTIHFFGIKRSCLLHVEADSEKRTRILFGQTRSGHDFIVILPVVESACNEVML